MSHLINDLCRKDSALVLQSSVLLNGLAELSLEALDVRSKVRNDLIICLDGLKQIDNGCISFHKLVGIFSLENFLGLFRNS